MDAPIVPATHGQSHYDEHPTTHPTTGGGHYTVSGGVEDVEDVHHHEKKPVLKKVKDKVRKIKDTISKKRHGHDGHDEHGVHYDDDDEYGYEDEDEDEEMEVDPVHGAPMYESTIAGNVVGGHDYYPGKERVVESTDNIVRGHEYYPVQEPVGLGNIKGDLEQDPAAPLPVSSPFIAGDIAQRPTISSTGGNELGVSPDVLSSLDAMAISVQRDGQKGDAVKSSPPRETARTGAEAEAADKKPSYTEKLSSTASAVKDAALSAASTVYGKVAGAGNPTDHQFPRPEKTRLGAEEEAVEKKPSYTEKITSTATAAKDAAVSAASTVYGKVAGAGTPTETEEKTRLAAEEEATEKKPSYTQKISSTAAAAKDAAVSAASTVYHKVAMGGGTPTGTHDQSSEKTPTVTKEETEKKPGYTGKLSSTATAAKDVAVSAASTVYDKVAGAGTAVMGKGHPGGTGAMEGRERINDKGVLVREFLSEKLKPGEEDRALCEVISETMQKREGEAMHKKGEEEVVVVERERVVAPAGGKGMAEKIKGAVSSLLGGGGASGASPVGGIPISGAGVGERAHQGTGSMETSTR